MKIRIYLVDDEPAVCHMVQSVLAGAGIDTITETNSSKAALRIPIEKFDAVFLDIHMPPPDGLELARIQRAGGYNMRTPIVMITGSGDRKILSKAYEAGGNYFLFKPFDRRRLLRIMRASLEFIQREKRRFQRVPISLPITIKTKDGKIDAMTVDMSLTGLLAQSPRVIPADTEVELSLILPDTKVAIKIKAKILRVVGKDHLAIVFQGIVQDDSDALHQFMLPLILTEIGRESSQLFAQA